MDTGRAASGAIIEKQSARTKRIRFTVTPLMLLGGRLLPACYHSYQCIGEFEPAAKSGRKSVQLAMLAPVENPIFADQQIYHKDPMSQNALIIWIPIRLSVPADFSIGSSISQSKRFDVELRRMDVGFETN